MTAVHGQTPPRRLHPYHGVRHQALSHQDFERCLDHCHWLLNMIRDDHQSLTNILWTYEATFNSNGGVNLHNRHYWSRTNPQWMQEVEHQGRFSVNVWCGIIGGQIIGNLVNIPAGRCSTSFFSSGPTMVKRVIPE
ncbi:hypothetical protein YQE_06385, partial [Dendroctonus ponderosae]